MSSLTEAMQDYLKTIWLLAHQDKKAVSTTALAEALSVTPASVTNMLKRLADLGLVEWAPYRGATLTPAGEKIALEVIRHHRLIELYLAEALGYSWDQVHEEAERLEHHISEQFEAAIAELLGHPTQDPHGDPIPTSDLEIIPIPTQPLTALKHQTWGIVRRVANQEPEVLRALAEKGVVPGTPVRLLEANPADETVMLQVRGRPITLAWSLAEMVYVENIETRPTHGRA
ncbi:MAG: metal-dependent transcriptional regulator [Ardenticatenia bacterium]|nr:metal-dependent transcriptional regulator [Ardenticatenia bacterium]